MARTNQTSELPDRLIGNAAQCELLGKVSGMTLYRRQQEPEYPQKIKIGGGSFRWLSEMLEYIKLKAAQTAQAEHLPQNSNPAHRRRTK
jgi:predicted DNA-binding transcriptional regulator AlpA